MNNNEWGGLEGVITTSDLVLKSLSMGEYGWCKLVEYERKSKGDYIYVVNKYSQYISNQVGGRYFFRIAMGGLDGIDLLKKIDELYPGEVDCYLHGYKDWLYEWEQEREFFEKIKSSFELDDDKNGGNDPFLCSEFDPFKELEGEAP